MATFYNFGKTAKTITKSDAKMNCQPIKHLKILLAVKIIQFTLRKKADNNLAEIPTDMKQKGLKTKINVFHDPKA